MNRAFYDTQGLACAIARHAWSEAFLFCFLPLRDKFSFTYYLRDQKRNMHNVV